MKIGENGKISAVVDTGATYSCISSNFYDKLAEEREIKGELPVQQIKLMMAVGNKKIEIKKQVILEMTWDDLSYNVLMLVVPGLFTSLVLGLNWLRENLILILCKENRLVKEKDWEKLMEKEEKKINEDVRITQKREEKLATLTDNRQENSMIIQQLKEHQREYERCGKDNVVSEGLSRPVQVEGRVLENHNIVVGSVRKKREEERQNIHYEDNPEKKKYDMDGTMCGTLITNGESNLASVIKVIKEIR